MDKTEFLACLLAEQATWETFLATVPPDLRAATGACGQWAVTDVVGHVAAWERFVTGMIRAHQRNSAAVPNELWGEFVPTGTLQDDALNEWLAAQLAPRSFDELLGMQREVRMQLVATVQTMSDELLTAPEVVVKGLPWKGNKGLWEVIASMSYQHAQDHLRDLRQWLDAQQNDVSERSAL